MLGKDNKMAVRLHSQEREWLLGLGDGNIIEGVKNLIEQGKEEILIRKDYLAAKREEAKWRV